MELLADMLEDRVGSLFSLQSLREELDVSHRAVSHWMEILECLYLCFRIQPFTHSAVRSLKKAAKVYLWDWSSGPLAASCQTGPKSSPPSKTGKRAFPLEVI